MATILLAIQVFIVIAIIITVLVQKSSSDSLAGLSGGGGGVFSARSAANFFSKSTLILGIALMINSLLIAKLYNHDSQTEKSIADKIVQESEKLPKAIPQAE